jgi:hypothetical protein
VSGSGPTREKLARERQKQDKAKAKAERRAARQAAAVDGPAAHGRSEAELAEELAAAHQAFERGEIPLETLESIQERVRAQFGV